MKRSLLWAAVLGLSSCGGRYEEPGSSGSAATDQTADPASSASAGSGGAKATPQQLPLPSHDLGTCLPGFDHAENPGRACPWITEAEQCFATNGAACACICPTDHVSVCYSDFDSPDASTLIHCK